MTGRANSIQEFKDGSSKTKRTTKRVPKVAKEPEPQAVSSTNQVTNAKSHMNLEELSVLYYMVKGKEAEIDAVRNSEHLDSMEKRVIDTMAKCLDTKLPEEIVRDTTQQILAVIDNTQQMSNLNKLEVELRGLQKQFDDALLSVAQVVEFNEESTFDKARGAKPRMVYREGRFKILRSSTNRREMNSKAFIEKYPFLAAEIAKIEIGKAEKALEKHLGKAESGKEMAEFCTTNTTHKYEFQVRSA